MADISIHCIIQPGTNATEVAAELKIYLHGIDGVTPIMVEIEHPRVGLAEILAIIQLASAATDLTNKLTDFIKSRRNKGSVKDIEVEIDGERVPVNSLTQDQRTRLAAAIARGT